MVVKWVGMPHGILFITYIIGVLLIRNKVEWNFKTTLIALAASILPFGTFYINKKYFDSF